MSEKRPISEVLRICIESLDNANPRPRTHFLGSSIEIDQRLPELLAIVEAAKDVVRTPLICSQCGMTFPEAACGPTHAAIAERVPALGARLRAAGEEPTR